MFHGILESRIERHLPISLKQKSFRKGDGVFFNSLLLHKIIRRANEECKNLSVAFLDVRKAFDHVSYPAIRAACKKLGVPRHLIWYLREFYSPSNTRLVLGGRLSDGISSIRGIKQAILSQYTCLMQ